MPKRSQYNDVQCRRKAKSSAYGESSKSAHRHMEEHMEFERQVNMGGM